MHNKLEARQFAAPINFTRPNNERFFTCTQQFFGGQCAFQEINTGQCQDLPDQFQNSVQSARPDPGFNCTLYTSVICPARLRHEAYTELAEVAVSATACSFPSLTTTSTPTVSTMALSRPRSMQTPNPLNVSGLVLLLPESPAQAPVSSMQTLNRYSICCIQ